MEVAFVHDYRGHPINRYDGDCYFDTEDGFVLDDQRNSPQRSYLIWKYGESKDTETIWKEWMK
ncbi:hypothetical protein NHG24_07935 [Aerococcaceae bacterium NML210727]|nr:hypothetical protein [Aerococcaceae bacterium NML210727]MCW6655061.1 hypothetical protein [Aerococcaceae bacterium NML201296]